MTGRELDRHMVKQALLTRFAGRFFYSFDQHVMSDGSLRYQIILQNKLTPTYPWKTSDEDDDWEKSAVSLDEADMPEWLGPEQIAGILVSEAAWVLEDLGWRNEQS